MQKQFLGIEIGGTKLQIVAGRHEAICERKKLEVNPASGAAGIRAQIQNVLPGLIERWNPTAVGVGFGGPVDLQKGRIARSHQIEGWSDFPIREWLERCSGLPVWLENDANTAALGEASNGAGARLNPVFYVTLGSGVGGGLVSGGQIYHGLMPGEAEIGHIRLDKAGTLVEERCSGWAVDRRIRRLKDDGIKGALIELLPDIPGGEAKFLGPALKADDSIAWGLLRDVAEDLGFALSHVVHLFHPQAVILGGGLSQLGEPLRLEVELSLSRFLMEVFLGKTQVKLAALGEDAVPVGCLIGAQSLGNRFPGNAN
jgi:glucokinase